MIPAAASPGLDALDRALLLDSQAHVEHDAPGGGAADRVEVGLDQLRDLLEQPREAQDQFAQRLAIEGCVVQLRGDPLGGVDQLIGLDVGARQKAKRRRPANGSLASAEPDSR